MSIRDIPSKIKEFGLLLAERDIFLAIIFILAVLSAYGLGRLSVLEAGEPVRIIEGEAAAALKSTGSSGDNKNETKPVQAQVVASKKGKYYYYPWCSGGGRIVEANKITFKSAAEAESAGYKLATSCPGL